MPTTQRALPAADVGRGVGPAGSEVGEGEDALMTARGFWYAAPSLSWVVRPAAARGSHQPRPVVMAS
ncbi:Hypothetical protein CAP_2684 [Chondromyces apiculatus DSM 436]|uniref:Uncharacterized protein n=1 Tax=Chondromyces apiculatus DSM 436 TaxID=1192034 RepID=A0A017THR5_9BACT|nr:Hypothetical protein CAP_2684 [Chondromyces apiculatus DSM 436]